MNHLWQSTLFVFAVWLAALALRRNAARVRCWLWTAASIKFLVPLSLLVSLGESLHWRAAPDVLQPAVQFVMRDVLAPVPPITPVAPITPVSMIAEAPTFNPQSLTVWPVWPWLLLAVWAGGAAVVLLSWWRQWLPIRAALRQATPLRLDAQYGAADLTVLSSPSMREPGVVGIWRPRLLLPEGIVQRLPPAQLRALIAHEQCHIRCHDNLAAAVHMVVEALFWFHPAVWWIEKRLVDERERACDEAVLRAGSRPRDYAEGILAVCRQSVGVGLACVAGVSGSNLRARVEAIMRNEIGRPMTRGRQWALAAAVVAAVAGPVAGGALTADAESQEVVPSFAIAFETASVTRGKVSPPGRSPDRAALEASLAKGQVSPRDGRFTTAGSLSTLIQVAYDVTRFQIEGGPAWVQSDRFEIEARPAGGATPDQIRAMLQSLLAERFQLTLRREARTRPVYELVAADGGLKIAAMREGGCTPQKEMRWDLIDLEAPLYICGSVRRRMLSQSPETRPLPRWPRVTRIEAGGASMSVLTDSISPDLDRVVLDRTGFTAPFNFVLDFAPASDPAASGPTIFDALQDQLGMQLRATSEPIDVLVIDRVEQPSH
jgi:bla regulator protein BlaR1